ncbi:MULTISPECIES: UDP-N-acetylmuramoyl-L-alanyl-D-glutamate--2,6-diaminopimelate ligase [unclassified Shewanella]|uniref:UDP-N-acetylmuramoyl-L-alanyl-D-glutamate--2, 6-diaminopimelate ligase n=1 Tax=unclassified Shewanella TaxID=196818 RepID=UPI000C852498|nr:MULTISPECIES: UDP-N-acetylmuramoyl-L-alanyl-D-glutamate--2,6-diaminopimelate ligase [unclassified Shewanella]MDO6618524.1 UDP-N-acetylmuramoyl-L-alanyl-D-glutamate--2,6-diaminopimelate ligase [Shewanella sp. 6_MG-2023]MDO6774360.1 UDP-N-acetylmuramoyl-L-alanyl-D-glutamate--2,6-diaminopimelate ligase [Shewanella sp. 3_MG-2023]PMG28834.1 UDP-N-acetylmuramoyl-L-alanyl-D-glutamate--2,6-diaminopimelate ligase [Shewanella sp. 10N.286.52.C2]PMG50139.1 UDP-N-acetylmuramoyl-L-alanyl-D-glutamate--2,6-
MMLLSDLLAPWFHYAGVESVDTLSLDSRQVSQGGLFVALPGHKVDGRKFISKAIESGAVGALIHTDNPDEHGQVEYQDNGAVLISFFQLTRQLSAVAAQLYPVNHSPMAIIGVTGTNGKTSVSQLIAQLVSLKQQKAAVMGTLGNGVWGQLIDSGNTTADAITLIRQLHQFQAERVNVCAIEVSSHGLVQGRVEAVPFDTAIFTNLSRDHLDYHGDMDAYGAAKKRLFTFSCVKNGLINLDDGVGQQWFDELTTDSIYGFSISANKTAQFYTDNMQFNDAGVQCDFVYPHLDNHSGQKTTLALRGRIVSPLLGDFNLANLVAALSGLYLQGYDMQELLELVPLLTPVAGRMERFNQPKGPTLVVDYAHTPDAIEQALKALRIHCKGKLWCVFGCGGDRDKGKRPLMAQAAEQFADTVMVTSDNARSEDPAAIIEDVLAGLAFPERALTQVDRIKAINTVASLAQTGDIVLLAGKGHETYQEANGIRTEYDERALAIELTQPTSNMALKERL